MITDKLIDLIYAIANFIISLFPAYTGLPTGMHSAIDYVFSSIAAIADFFPMSTVWTIFFLWASIEVSLMVIKMILWAFLGRAIKGGIANRVDSATMH